MTGIRAATAADVPALHRLVERAYRGDHARRGWTHEADLLDGQRTDVAALHEAVADPARAILLAEDHGELAGCVEVAGKGDGLAYVGMVSVDPDRQAAGMGRQLLAAAEEHAQQHFGATRVEMTVIERRAELIAWYERRGYAPTGERRPFPLDNPRFGLPRTRELEFVVLEKWLNRDPSPRT